VSVYLYLCLSVYEVRLLQKWRDGSSWFLTRRLPSTCSTLHFKEILVSPKYRYFLRELCSTLRTSPASRLCCQQNTRRWSSLLTTSAAVDALCFDEQSLLHVCRRNALTQLLRFVVDLYMCNFCIYTVSQKNKTPNSWP